MRRRKKLEFDFYIFDRKIHKQVIRIEALQLADAQSTGLRRRRPQPEFAAVDL